jgi:hypothetical protein
MPISFEVVRENGYVHSRCHGEMQVDDYVQHIKTVWSNPDNHGFNELINATAGDFSNFFFTELLSVLAAVALADEVSPNTRLAIVVCEGKQKALTDFYLNAKAASEVEKMETQVFFDEEQALNWVCEGQGVGA